MSNYPSQPAPYLIQPVKYSDLKNHFKYLYPTRFDQFDKSEPVLFDTYEITSKVFGKPDTWQVEKLMPIELVTRQQNIQKKIDKKGDFAYIENIPLYYKDPQSDSIKKFYNEYNKGIIANDAGGGKGKTRKRFSSKTKKNKQKSRKRRKSRNRRKSQRK